MNGEGALIKYFIFHGTASSPDANWFPWLEAELLKLGHEVMVPMMPTPEGQTLENWFSVFDEQFQLTKDTVLIGHSIGAVFVARLLERSEVKIKAAYLVSVWEGLLDSPDFDPLIKTFFETPIDYSKIKSAAQQIRVYHGSDDPYVPLTMGEAFAGNLKVETAVLANAGHINAETGYLSFPGLLEDILT